MADEPPSAAESRRTERLLKPFKPIRDWIKPHEAWLRGLAALGVAYTALLAAVARTAPAGIGNWTGGDAALAAAFVGIALVLVYAGFEVVDDHFTDREREEADRLRNELEQARTELSDERDRSELRRRVRDLDRTFNRLCQSIVNDVLTALPGAFDPHDVAAHVWLCDHRDDSFVRRWVFHLPYERVRSGIQWGKGKGVAGWAWKTGEPQTARLTELHAAHGRGRKAFEKFSEERKYGMTFEEISMTREAGYTGVIALPIYSKAEPGRMLAVFGLDYSGDEARFAEVAAIIRGKSVRGTLGMCQTMLTDADRDNILWSSPDERTQPPHR